LDESAGAGLLSNLRAALSFDSKKIRHPSLSCSIAQDFPHSTLPLLTTTANVLMPIPHTHERIRTPWRFRFPSNDHRRDVMAELISCRFAGSVSPDLAAAAGPAFPWAVRS
jgi:hypothetical protein